MTAKCNDREMIRTEQSLPKVHEILRRFVAVVVSDVFRGCRRRVFVLSACLEGKTSRKMVEFSGKILPNLTQQTNPPARFIWR